MGINLTQCIKCDKCWDKDGIIYPFDPDFFYSSGLCPTCFTEAVRYNQLQTKGYYCFGLAMAECKKPNCSYREKCENMKNQKE